MTNHHSNQFRQVNTLLLNELRGSRLFPRGALEGVGNGGVGEMGLQGDCNSLDLSRGSVEVEMMIHMNFLTAQRLPNSKCVKTSAQQLVSRSE